MGERDYHHLQEPKSTPSKDLPQPQGEPVRDIGKLHRREGPHAEALNAEITGEEDNRRPATKALACVRSAVKALQISQPLHAIGSLKDAEKLLEEMDARTGRPDPSVRENPPERRTVAKKGTSQTVTTDGSTITIAHELHIPTADFDVMRLADRASFAKQAVAEFDAYLKRLWSLG